MVTRTTLEQLGSLDTWGDFHIEQTTQTSENALQACWLNQFSALKINGPDAERFLQGQLTCNLNDIDINTVHFGACCNAKGRIVANFTISFDGENYWLVLPTLSANLLEKYLQKYKVFFKANIENCTNSHLIFGLFNPLQKGANQGDAVHQVTPTCSHQRLSISQQRQILVIENGSDYEVDLLSNLLPTLDWRLADISDGIFYTQADQSEQWIPQHINWHQLGGISFNKGCYTGQEIIARLQYLGKAKKSLQHYQLDAETDAQLALSALGTQLFSQEGKSLGDILIHRSKPSSSQSAISVLAVINSENPHQTLYLTDSKDFPLTLQNLPYTEEKDA